MGEFNVENMPLPAIFEQARTIHQQVTDSDGATDQVRRSSCQYLFFFSIGGNGVLDLIGKLAWW